MDGKRRTYLEEKKKKRKKKEKKGANKGSFFLFFVLFSQLQLDYGAETGGEREGTGRWCMRRTKEEKNEQVIDRGGWLIRWGRCYLGVRYSLM